MTSMPLVSVVMATYNRSAMLADTMENIYRQDYRPLEVLVINDGSADDTLIVLQDLQKKYPFSLIDNPQNVGLQKSLNKGIQKAKGKYIARIDDHDKWLMQDKLSKQVAVLEQQQEIALVGTAYRMDGKVFNNPLTDEAIRKQILLRSPFCHPSILMRRSVLDVVGLYDEEMNYSEDWDMWLRIGTVAALANLPEVAVEVQAPKESSLSGTHFLKQLPLNRHLVRKYAKHYPSAFKACLYHAFLACFFKIFSLGGRMHRLMQQGFYHTFLKKNTKTKGLSCVLLFWLIH